MDQLSQTRLAEITAKSPADLTEAEVAFLRARRSYLTDEQRAVFAAALEIGQPPEGGTPVEGPSDSNGNTESPAPKKKGK